MNDSSGLTCQTHTGMSTGGHIKKSCQKDTGACTDDETWCAKFEADTDQCKTIKLAMSCKKTCNMCGATTASTTTVDPNKPVQCKNRASWCSNFEAGDRCAAAKIAQYCPAICDPRCLKTVGTTGGPSACTDAETWCPKYATKKTCATQKFDSCALSCKKCGATEAPKECKDRGKVKCDQKACSNAFYAQRNCPKTCNLCPGQTTLTPTKWTRPMRTTNANPPLTTAEATTTPSASTTTITTTTTKELFCGPGQYVNDAGLKTAACKTCAAGTFQDKQQHFEAKCEDVQDCAPDQFETPGRGPTLTRDRECSTKKTCNTDTQYAVSSNAGADTVCRGVRSCFAGDFVSAQPTKTSDRTCSRCAAKTFTTTENAGTCQAMTLCQEDQYMKDGGTHQKDRVCVACPAGQVQPLTDHSQTTCDKTTTTSTTVEFTTTTTTTTTTSTITTEEGAGTDAPTKATDMTKGPTPGTEGLPTWSKENTEKMTKLSTQVGQCDLLAVCLVLHTAARPHTIRRIPDLNGCAGTQMGWCGLLSLLVFDVHVAHNGKDQRDSNS